MNAFCSDQGVVRRVLSNEFSLQAIHANEEISPAKILKDFFCHDPRRRGLHFTGLKQPRIYSRSEVASTERHVSNILLNRYYGFTCAPSPRDIMRDVFAELEKLNMRVSLRLVNPE